MKTKLLTIAAALLVCGQSNAQVSAYSFTQFPGSYGSSVQGTVIGLQLQDDDVNTVTLPFPFTFNGQTYNSADISTNGCLSFTTLTGTEYSPVSDMSTSNVISAFGEDLLMTTFSAGDLTAGSPSITNMVSVTGFSVGDVLLDWNNDFASNPTIINIVGNTIVVNQNALNTASANDVLNNSGAIIQSISGVAPNRVCQFEYKRMSRLFVDFEGVNFKIRLYETSNRIEIIYGDVVSGPDATPVEVGLKGNTNADYNSRKVGSSNTWAASLPASIITDVCNFNINIAPVAGQVYQWTPPTCTVPVVVVASSNNAICSGNSAVLTASGATTYSWVSGPATAQNTVSPVATTVYTLIGANSSCTSSATFTQVVLAAPALSLSAAQATICAGQSTSLTASGATSYSWNGVAGNAVNVISPSTNSTYTLAASNGSCVATRTISQAVTNCTGIDALANNTRLYAAYPNPFNALLELDNTSGAEVEVTLCDALGSLIYTGTAASSEKLKINTDNLPRGVYVLSVKGAMVSESKRLVKN